MIEIRLLPVAEFHANCLIRNEVYNFRKVVNLYISWTLDTWSSNLNPSFILNNCLLGSVMLSKNADPSKKVTDTA